MSRITKWVRQVAAQLNPVPVSLVAQQIPNQKYKTFASTGAITIAKSPILADHDVFFAMGSCFAERIRSALTRRNIVCTPKYREISFDPTEALVDDLPQNDHMNFYNTFTVRMQLEQALGLGDQQSDDYWTVHRQAPWGSLSFQDPYRRLILAKSPEILARVISSVNEAVRRGFDEASAFIFTFGMTEVFVNNASGKVVAQKPLYRGGGGKTETTIHVSTFAENLDNILAIIDLIRARKPDAPIILTVSPVALSHTFQSADVVTVNTESKSILRAAIGQASRERKGVIYLPSYEYVTAKGFDHAYGEDRRHIRREVVNDIVDQFFASYFTSAKT